MSRVPPDSQAHVIEAQITRIIRLQDATERDQKIVRELNDEMKLLDQKIAAVTFDKKGLEGYKTMKKLLARIKDSEKAFEEEMEARRRDFREHVEAARNMETVVEVMNMVRKVQEKHKDSDVSSDGEHDLGLSLLDAED